MREIPLSQGKFALVDDEDYEWLMQWKWQWALAPGRNGYAIRKTPKFRDRQTIFMHRLILQAPAGLDVDHKDLDTLNNQRANIRIATRSQNKQNEPKRNLKNTTSQYKGVSYIAASRKWYARITVDGKYRHIGSYNTEVEAARAYDEMAIKHFGQFARTNF